MVGEFYFIINMRCQMLYISIIITFHFFILFNYSIIITLLTYLFLYTYQVSI